jgi:glutaminyl-tRNA synthetase
MSSSTNFIRNIIVEDLASGKNTKVVTRFPPEPNGFLHIGHAKSICLNFSLAQEFDGACHLRFDDSNPETEDNIYIESIKEDVAWLGFDWKDKLFYASDYFEKLYQFAVSLIKKGKAFVCDLTFDQIREHRGTLEHPGIPSPYRDRSVAENLQLFEMMRAGKFKDGQKVLRAKIDMSSPNINMRDPIIYRIKYFSHPRVGNRWCIYPMYDFCHALSDFIEGITYSICTLEFEDHRPLYDWCIDELNEEVARPRQIEFARLNLSYTLTSKRKLLELVQKNIVAGWDDPRMPTISGLRERGIPASAIRDFCSRIGVTKKDSCIDLNTFENILRENLEKIAPRILAVTRPLKIIITDLPADHYQEFDAQFNQKDPSFGHRKIPFTSEIYIDSNDFQTDPPKDFFRLKPGGEVRLRHAYVIKCEEVVQDNGEITLKCIHYPHSKDRKVRGVIHWVSAKTHQKHKVLMFDRLFLAENPAADDNYLENLNANSLKEEEFLLENNWEESLKNSDRPQFERQGYFYKRSGHFNLIVPLKNSWK